ncbi:MAG: hypothetical protein IJS00_00450 [Paludibacteraceae bacterium]|nr:hypothetical protein [Paludibacteraceae bacterium]
MLPLWIIDITAQSERRVHFQHLLAQIKHVRLSKQQSSTDEQTIEKETVTHPSSSFIRDIEKEEALQRNIIEGDYWWYSQVKDYLKDINEDDAQLTATRLYEMQSDLVEEGQRFLKHLRQSNVKPYQTINIIVLGDATEQLTQHIFASMAAVLQKEKERILPNHIHQGMEIMGMLFLPSDTNSRKVSERHRIRRMLEEIDVQHTISSIRGYDHVILWQDVQNRTENVYPLLDSKGQAEYILQCLVHLYLACDITHPVISGTGAADTFYLSLGMASVFFDLQHEDRMLGNELERSLLNSLKSEGLEEKYNEHLELITKDEYAPEQLHILNNIAPFFTQTIVEPEREQPSPHPINDMASRRLKRDFYRNYLRFFPARFLQEIVAFVEEKTNPMLSHIAADSQRAYKDAQHHIKDNLDRTISQLSANDGGLPIIKYLFRNMQEKLAGNRQQINNALERRFWTPLYNNLIADSLQEDFMFYHDAYREDLRNKSARNQNALKQEALNNLRLSLSQTHTLLSHIARTFFLSLLMLLIFVPILQLITSHPILWTALIMLMPMMIQLTGWLFWKRKTKQCVRRLHAYYLHEAYARIANRIDNEINGFYDKLIALAGEYRHRAEQISADVVIPTLNDTGDTECPKTMFNQPLHGGRFAGKPILHADDMRDCFVRVNYIPRPFNELSRKDYYMLINQFHRDIMILFNDVYLTENLIKTFDTASGDTILLSKTQQEEIKAQQWHKNIELFKARLTEDMAYVMVPREYSSVGEKLCENSRMTGRKNLLKPILEMAAPNGEISSTADTEYADIKTNQKEISHLAAPYLPVVNTKYQIEPYDIIYQKYIFVTRWRSFEHLPYNRILPTEDFDTAIRQQRVYQHNEKSAEKPPLSSLLLWALCPNDTSSVWLRLFDAEHFAQAYNDRNKYREILNQDD